MVSLEMWISTRLHNAVRFYTNKWGNMRFILFTLIEAHLEAVWDT